MSSERQTASVRDLVDEAKKRIVFLVVCVVGLSYLMSLTSSSVLVNFPAATFLIIIFRYLSLDFEMRRKAATFKSKPKAATKSFTGKPFEVPRVTERADWKLKVNSPVVEDAICQFSGHIVSEWVTDLWYCRVTPDRQGPEELVLIINGVFGEISNRLRNINLIEILTMDIIGLFCNRLELFRACKTKIEKQQSKSITIEERDIELKSVLAAENKLHPALFSSEAEHKVLQHVVDGLISLTFKPEDLQCSLFRYVVRELLACVVIRPALNIANPKFINERIESLIISASKNDKGSKLTNITSQSSINGSSKTSSPDHNLQFPDPSVKGVELVPLKKGHNSKDSGNLSKDSMNGTLFSKDPLLSVDAQSTRSWSSLPEINNDEGKGLQRHRSGGEWGDVLDVFSRRKTEALAPEHFDNMWTKGKDYKKEDTNHPADLGHRNSLMGMAGSLEQSGMLSEKNKREGGSRGGSLEKDFSNSGYNKYLETNSSSLCKEEIKHQNVQSDGMESWSDSYSEEEESNSVTGLGSPGVKVWDGKNKRNFSHIHHPLENLDGHKSRKANKPNLQPKKLHRTKSAKKRSRPSSHKGLNWQEDERMSSLFEEREGVDNSFRINYKLGDLSEDSEEEQSGRTCSGAATSSSMSLASLPESHSLAAQSAKNSIISDSFFRLRCEVTGANIVKSGSKTFAIYCISVADVNNNSWSIKRRFRHFEELHRRLKDFTQYNLQLPPKHFLSTGLDVLVIQERCKLLDQYLKRLLQLSSVSCSIEVWDFLSVDSQMYVFSNSFTIVETLSGPFHDGLSSRKENFSNGTKLKMNNQAFSSPKTAEKEFKKASGFSNNYAENLEHNKSSVVGMRKVVNRDLQMSHSTEASDSASDPTIPSEWIPPNLSAPILDLVDVILQLKDGGWIRRKAFWVAKQVLQLGMGDAFDDWLIEKIQLLRRGSVIASGIKRLEQILWPDGIFITKHPSRQRPSPAGQSHDSQSDKPSTPRSSSGVDTTQNVEEMQQKEADRRAKLVYEVMIDKAPAAVVGLVGHKEYEVCAKDLYYFIQSSVCMKQLAYDLLQLLLLSAFPELNSVFRQLEEEKEKFGKLDLK